MAKDRRSLLDLDMAALLALESQELRTLCDATHGDLDCENMDGKAMLLEMSTHMRPLMLTAAYVAVYIRWRGMLHHCDREVAHHRADLHGLEAVKHLRKEMMLPTGGT